ncbi:MAG: hypothetical protein JSW11_10625 [Candidatus Heimdallarchaeota archaeon]|nr:MAG: hypothetical protein JSW11_10625 [Candidatus Heimdallarchaeota archaeon]
MPAGQATAHFFRILYIIVFVFSCLLIIGIPIPIDNPILATSIDPTMFDFAQVFNIVEYVMLLVQELVRAFAGVALTLVATIASSKKDIPFLGDTNFDGVAIGEMQSILAAIVNPENGFLPHSNVTDIATFLEDFGNFFGATTILILLPVALLSGVGFLREGDTKLAIYSFLGFQLIIIIAIFTEKIIVNTRIDSSTIITMLFSPIFALGFLLYLLLEIAFQTSYTLNIIEPMTEREKRIQGHLKRIRSFVPLSEEEKGKEQSIQSVQSKKFGLLAASYLREMVERRVFKKGEVMRDAKSTMRLQSYLASLNQSDPETDLKLAAKTAQPDVSALLRHFIPAMIFRIIAVTILAYIIISPEILLTPLVGASFPALLQSLELTQPEFQTIAILNVVLLFILISVILHFFSGGRTGKIFERVVQQIDTLVDFDRSSTPVAAAAGETPEEEEEEEPPADEEEEIS